jgi:MATE family multidrug resistance protein
VARGSGWQKIGAYINLGSFYLVGLPLAAVLGFSAHLRGKGLWIGILAGSFAQSVLLSIVTACTDWNKQVPSFFFFPSLVYVFICCSIRRLHQVQ